MDKNTSPLVARLGTIWKPPDFPAFFEKFAKRPPHKIKKDSLIFYEGDQPNKIYFIKKGFVKMHRVAENGKDPIIYLYGPGSILGVRALTSKNEELKHDAEALTDVEIQTISRQEYLDILSKHPEYIVDLLHVFIERLNYAERKVEGFILTDTLARVANFLCDCAHRFGEKKNGEIVIPIPLTHQRIAEFVGAFRETVTIAINKLEDEKIITVKKGQVTILNPKKLEQKIAIFDNF